MDLIAVDQQVGGIEGAMGQAAFLEDADLSPQIVQCGVGDLAGCAFADRSPRHSRHRQHRGFVRCLDDRDGVGDPSAACSEQTHRQRLVADRADRRPT